MDHERFIDLVAHAVGGDRETAERATRATLQTLAERITAGEARHLAAELPPELAPWLATGPEPDPFDVDELLRRVAEREGVDIVAAERHVRAVLAVLGQAVSDHELGDLAAQLPKDFAPLLPTGPAVEVVPADAFVQRVAERARLDADTARRATEATLETLAERIAGGEVDDLIARLPAALHAPLRHGREHSGGRAARIPLEKFVQRVAERDGASAAEAREHARAVFLTLREAVGDREFYDVTVQLPDEYVAALAR